MSLIGKLSKNSMSLAKNIFDDVRNYDFSNSITDIENYDWNNASTTVKSEAGALFSDSTAINAAMTPMYAASEIFVAGMSVENSLDARILAAGVTYAGTGRLLGKLRQVSSKKFLHEKPTKKQQNTHDFLYMGAVGLVLNPAFYLAVGVTDPIEILLGTAAGTAINMSAGIPTGYALDWFSDLLGVQEAPENRLPNKIRNLSSSAKKYVAAGLVGAAIGLTAMVYEGAPGNVDSSTPEIPTEELTELSQKSYDTAFSNSEL